MGGLTIQEQAMLQRLQHKRDNFDAAAAAASAPKRKTGNQGQPASSPAGQRAHRGESPWEDDGLDASENEQGWGDERDAEDAWEQGEGDDGVLNQQDGLVTPSPRGSQNSLLDVTGVPGQRVNPAGGGAALSAARRQKQLSSKRFGSAPLPKTTGGQRKSTSAHGRSSVTPSTASSGAVKVKADTAPVKWASSNMIAVVPSTFVLTKSFVPSEVAIESLFAVCQNRGLVAPLLIARGASAEQLETEILELFDFWKQSSKDPEKSGILRRVAWQFVHVTGGLQLMPVTAGGNFPDGSTVHFFYSQEPNKYAFIVTKSSEFSNGFRSDWKSMYASKLNHAKALIAKGGRSRKPLLIPSEMEAPSVEVAVASGGDDDEDGDGPSSTPDPKRRKKTVAASRQGRWKCEWCRGEWQAQDRDDHARLCHRVSCRSCGKSAKLCQCSDKQRPKVKEEPRSPGRQLSPDSEEDRSRGLIRGQSENNPLELEDTPSRHSTEISDMTTVTEAIDDVLAGKSTSPKKKGQSWKRKRAVMGPAVEPHVSTVGRVPRTTAVSQRAGKLLAEGGVDGDSQAEATVARGRVTRSGTRQRSSSASAQGDGTAAEGASAKEGGGVPGGSLAEVVEESGNEV